MDPDPQIGHRQGVAAPHPLADAFSQPDKSAEFYCSLQVVRPIGVGPGCRKIFEEIER